MSILEVILVNKERKHFQFITLFCATNSYYVANSGFCHEDMTGKRGENVTKVNINITGKNAFLFPMEFLHFSRKIPSLLHF